MFRNSFKIAWRVLWKNKAFSAINIIGLAIGIATCFVIVLYIAYELGYDKYNVNADRIYRVDNQMKFGNNMFDSPQEPAPMGPAFAKAYPQIEHYVRFRNQGELTVSTGNKTFIENKVTYADSSLFPVFTLPFLAGDPKTALTEPYSVVITQRIAKKYFNGTNVLEKTLVANGKNYRITGVIKDIPQQSHFNFDFFIALAGLDESREDNWLSTNFQTYILIKPGTDIYFLEKQFNQTLQAYTAPQLKDIANHSSDYVRCSLFPLTKIHLYSNKMGELGENGNIQYVYIFSAIAIFILLIACVNFMNLSTARSSNRAKEVGVRKVLGSFKKHIIFQFLTESLLISFIAFIIAFGITLLMIPYFNQLTQKHINGQVLFSPGILFATTALMIIVGLTTGSYPAFFFSSFKPIEVLKGKLSRGFKRSLFSNSLVVFQFVISIILIVGTIIVYNQLSYMRHKNVGFNKDQVLVIENTQVLKSQAQAFKNELMQLNGIKSVTFSGFLPVNGWRNSDTFYPAPVFDTKNAIAAQQWDVDENYIPTLQMQLKTGRNFSSQLPSDSNAVIINETAAKRLNTENVINKKLYVTDDKKVIAYNIIGVIKDFNFNSLREPVTPLALHLHENIHSMALRIDTRDIPGIITQINSKWKAMVPSQAFSYSFMDDSFNKQYSADQRTGTISGIFSVIAILIACVGLFGLTAYAAEQRVKEIGIRKVLGASVSNIMTMLTEDFFKLVSIAIIISSPIAWWVMNLWLRDFAYRVSVSFWVFVLAGSLAIFIALLTVSFQAIKAAIANPIKSLRTE